VPLGVYLETFLTGLDSCDISCYTTSDDDQVMLFCGLCQSCAPWSLQYYIPASVA
jgi:hypothetical protein